MGDCSAVHMAHWSRYIVISVLAARVAIIDSLRPSGLQVSLSVRST